MRANETSQLPGHSARADLGERGSVTASSAAEVLDIAAIAKATRTMSGQLELDKLLACTLDIMFEIAGAESGAVVLETPDGPIVAASRVAGASQLSTAGVALAGADVVVVGEP